MIASYVGYALDSEVRYKATSGGVGTSILKYLFEHDIIQTSITFDYDNKTLQYYPRLINSYEEYKMTGSIYHEIKLIQFIKEHVAEIKGNFACFVLPCQARAIRSILDRNDVKSILIGLTCSSQQSIDATYYLLKRLHVDKDDVQYIQYRGNGWPSGVQIKLKNESEEFVPNNNSIWMDIFHSKLFIQKRCFTCTNTLNDYSDISLADPWLSNYVKIENVGATIVICNTNRGLDLINALIDVNYVKLDNIECDVVTQSQKSTIDRKRKYLNNRKLVRVMHKFFLLPLYRNVVMKSVLMFELHNKFLRVIESKCLK